MPLALGSLWDRDALVAEIHRVAAKGCTAISLPETPYGVGLPSFYTDHWDPVFEALCDTDMAICMHIGGAFGLLKRPEGAPFDQLIIMSPQLSAVATTDLMVSGTFNRFPDLKVAMSEGGIGWIPFLLDRIDRHISNHSWTGLDFGGLNGTELFRKNFLGCFITDPSALHLVDRIGVEAIAWECDYPHSDSTWPTSPEALMGEVEAAHLSDPVINQITWENACRFFRFDPFARDRRIRRRYGPSEGSTPRSTPVSPPASSTGLATRLGPAAERPSQTTRKESEGGGDKGSPTEVLQIDVKLGSTSIWAHRGRRHRLFG